MTKILVRSPDGHDHHLIDPEALSDPAYADWTKRSDAAAAAVSLDVARAAKRAEIMQKLAACFEAGFTPSSGPLLGHRLQVREDDKANWLTSQAAYAAAVSAGAGELPGATFRTMANATIGCTFAQGLETLLDMASWGQQVMGRSWALKDAVLGAPDVATVEAIDIEAGWPGAVSA